MGRPPPVPTTHQPPPTNHPPLTTLQASVDRGQSAQFEVSRQMEERAAAAQAEKQIMVESLERAQVS